MPRGRRGYTLVEVLVSLSIALILVTVIVVGAKSIRESGRHAEAQRQLTILAQAIDQYASFWPQWKTSTGLLEADKGWPDYIGGRLFYAQPDAPVYESIVPFNSHPTFDLSQYATPGSPSGIYRPNPANANRDYVLRGDVLSANICLAYALTSTSGKGPYLPLHDRAMLKDIADPILMETFNIDPNEVQMVLGRPLLPGYSQSPGIATRAQVLVDPWGTPYRYFWAYRAPQGAAYRDWLPVSTADVSNPDWRVAQGFVIESAGANRKFGNLWQQNPTPQDLVDAADNLIFNP